MLLGVNSQKEILSSDFLACNGRCLVAGNDVHCSTQTTSFSQLWKSRVWTGAVYSFLCKKHQKLWL